jgi:hypothetical protein
MVTNSCVECGKVEGCAVSLKTCKSCKLVMYCSAACQRNHWVTHKKICKRRTAELRDEALFKDPPPKEDCPICFLPMPSKLICCVSLPPATISSVPINDFANEHEELAATDTDLYFPCCGKCICGGCVQSFAKSGNDTCPFCNSDRGSKTVKEDVEDTMKRVETNDAVSICVLAHDYRDGVEGLEQDRTKAIELYARSADLGHSRAHFYLADIYFQGGDLKMAKIHFEAAAMTGHETARYNLGMLEAQSGNRERAMKHLRIAASAGQYHAMHHLRTLFEQGAVSRESIDSTLKAYNNSCAEMRSKARDAYIRVIIEMNESADMNT